MEQVQFSKAMQPSEVEVAGAKVKLFFSMRVASKLEAMFGQTYLDIVLEMLQAPGDDGKPRPPMAIKKQAAIVSALMEEAGQKIDPKDLEGLHMMDFAALARAAQNEILLKMPEDKKKVTEKVLMHGIGQKSSGSAAKR